MATTTPSPTTSSPTTPSPTTSSPTTPSPTTSSPTTPSPTTPSPLMTCDEVSARDTCNGVQSSGKQADICCAAECCTCGDSTSDNSDCRINSLRASPPAFCTGGEAPDTACSLPAEIVEDTCGIEGMTGIAHSDGVLCCPSGCGTCGGTGCGSVPMAWVAPGEIEGTVSSDIPDGDTSGDYCCSSVRGNTTTICGVDGGEPPCLIPTGTVAATPAPTVEVMPAVEVTPTTSSNSTCVVVEGIADKTGTRCCPLGCGMCEGNGCGSVDMSDVLPGETITNDMNSADYCCSSAFEDPDIAVCAVDGGEAPCIILAETSEDTCNVLGVEGIADSSFSYCCPIGCGLCGGDGCGGIPMSLVMPGDTPGSIAAGYENETSSNFCCETIFTTPPEITVDCGVILPPCLIPVGTEPKEVATPSPVTSPQPFKLASNTFAPTSTPTASLRDFDSSTTPSPVLILSTTGPTAGSTARATLFGISSGTSSGNPTPLSGTDGTTATAVPVTSTRSSGSGSNSGLTRTEVVGLGIGVGAAALLLAIGGMMYMSKRKSNSGRDGHGEDA